MAPKSKKHRSGGAARHRSIATTDSEDFSWNCLQKVVMRGAGATRISDKHCKEMQCSSKQYLNLISKRFVTRLISLAADYTKSRKSVTLNIKDLNMALARMGFFVPGLTREALLPKIKPRESKEDEEEEQV